MTRRRAWVLAGGLLVAVLALAAVAALRSGEDRRSVAAGCARVTGADDRTLTFVVPTCHGDPTISVTELATEVHVKIISDSSSGDKCADNVETRLRDALGARVIIDDKTGSNVPIDHG